MVQEQAGCLGQSVDVAVAERVYSAVEIFCENSNHAVHAAENEVGFGGHWHFNVGRWEPGHCVGLAFCFRVPDPHAVASVVFQCGANAPGVHSVGCPASSVFGAFVCQDSNANGGYERGVVVEAAVEEFVG